MTLPFTNDLGMWSPISFYENATYFHLERYTSSCCSCATMTWHSPSLSQHTTAATTLTSPWHPKTSTTGPSACHPFTTTTTTTTPPSFLHPRRYTIATLKRRPDLSWWKSILRFKRKLIYPMIKRKKSCSRSSSSSFGLI
ncbi:hypothetical protein BC941DRAFT_131945 [Chlamydoabsidia padenii]|nr:hypothetical protein BC941DRAFT_131945 [Chlamydoabsidia padenii]